MPLSFSCTVQSEQTSIIWQRNRENEMHHRTKSRNVNNSETQFSPLQVLTAILFSFPLFFVLIFSVYDVYMKIIQFQYTVKGNETKMECD